ncbi:MAG: hypothetical protein OXI75_11250 [Rhodospirillales bacterium]|nr:hypothetical protein [Rhodospirillales bacterium]
MAQARRASRAGWAGRPSPDAVLLAGSYSFEQKVTVEWEKPLALDEFEKLLAPLLAEPRSFAEIRAYVSGALRVRDPALPPGKISKYLVSTLSLRDALAAMVAAERLMQSEAPNSGAQLWSRARHCVIEVATK